MQLYVNLNTWKILVNNNTYFYNSKILIKASLISFILFFIYGLLPTSTCGEKSD
ncbi:hypothetical protein [Spiroplasma ixodetis]|uniref:hypothetical protein n=1 Tax=Spiroplasma ixodetis TaxID=2141 RepID=UPI002493BF14|nr:hypothetical protein [Spiroplasma ixodetis]